MASGGVPDPVYTCETALGFRIMALLIDEGTLRVQAIFDKAVSRMSPGNLKEQLTINKRSLTDYSRKIRLNFDQQNIVYPSRIAVDRSKTFDIALLSLLLGILCRVKPPRNGWSEEPPADDESDIAWIIRLRLFRNENFGHITNTALSNTEFEDLWKKLSKILIKLGADKDKISGRKTQTIDPEQAKIYEEKFRKLHQDDNKVKDLLNAWGKEITRSVEENTQRQISETIKTRKELQHIETTRGKHHKQLSDKLSKLEEEQKKQSEEMKRTNKETQSQLTTSVQQQQELIEGQELSEKAIIAEGQKQSEEIKTTVIHSVKEIIKEELKEWQKPTVAEEAKPSAEGTLENNNSEVDGQNNIQHQHDFSVLCSKNDGTWTKTNVVEKLEQEQLTGYFPFRDVVGGDSVFQFLIDGVAKSRHVIVVFSPSTDSDKWFQKGYQTAVAEKLDGNLKGRVIPVLLNGLTKSKLPIELRDTAPLNAEGTDFFEQLQKSLSKLV